MISFLKRAKSNEVHYKEAVDNANMFLLDFRKKISDLISQLHTYEKDRCEAVHSTINKFVVYEMSSEMNNKYDVNNFSKILEEYKNEDEIKAMKEYL